MVVWEEGAGWVWLEVQGGSLEVVGKPAVGSGAVTVGATVKPTLGTSHVGPGSAAR